MKLMKNITLFDAKHNETWIFHENRLTNGELNYSVHVILKDIDQVYACTSLADVPPEEIEKWFTNAYREETSIIYQIARDASPLLAGVIDNDLYDLRKVNQ